jgi:hypothetical protein
VKGLSKLTEVNGSEKNNEIISKECGRQTTDREKTTEMFLIAQGYGRERIVEAISILSGNSHEFVDPASPTLTPRELCKLLRISTTTLWRLQPPHIIVGCRKRYQIEEVKEFLKHHQEEKQAIAKPAA